MRPLFDLVKVLVSIAARIRHAKSKEAHEIRGLEASFVSARALVDFRTGRSIDPSWRAVVDTSEQDSHRHDERQTRIDGRREDVPAKLDSC